ncbi:Fic family protein [Arsenicicoccus bolidensis]|uniref:Fic family protein n=1 Tax=Arsenicicoccus bolidensis TaxID=229480 RepID=UPI0004255E31|nr:Fic family protein [Arsenicicoccus bolidensis]
MIVDNVHAMQAALDLADHLDADAILQMHHALMRRSDPDIAGSFRTDQVWVGGPPSLGPGAPHQSDFVPPVAPRVPPPVSDLLEFSRRLDLHVIPQVAVAHAQFETIHPFSDGNGRVGRALMHAMLRAKGLTHQISVPISAGLLTDTAATSRP